MPPPEVSSTCDASANTSSLTPPALLVILAKGPPLDVTATACAHTNVHIHMYTLSLSRARARARARAYHRLAPELTFCGVERDERFCTPDTTWALECSVWRMCARRKPGRASCLPSSSASAPATICPPNPLHPPPRRIG